MKLYNKTRIPDDVIAPALLEAGRAAHARTTNVVVIVNPGRTWHSRVHGMAHRSSAVARWLVSSRRHTKTSGRTELVKGWVDTDGGYFSIVLPVASLPRDMRRTAHDPLIRAESFYAIAAHEWAHIRQYQQGVRFDRAQHNRRHDNRPWERAANRVMKAASSKLTSPRQDAIIALAIALDEKEAK